MTSSSTNQQEPPSSSSSSTITNWDSVIGKNVKTIDYQEAGKVVMTNIGEGGEDDAIIISSEGTHSSYHYKVPKNLVQGFEGSDLMLSIVRAELADYEINDIKEHATQLKSITREKKDGVEEIIVPIIEEKLIVSKKVITDEVTIIKEPITETKTIEVSVMHEQLVLEKRPAAVAEEEGGGEEGEEGENTSTFEKPPPRNTITKIRVPLLHEEVKIKKEPYIKEEIVIRKKPRTETATISESVISEKVVETDGGSNSPIAQAS